MRLHSDTLTVRDLTEAAGKLEGVWLDDYSVHGSRSRKVGIEFRLAAEKGPGRRRRNTGTHGVEDAYMPARTYAATWDEHGYFFADLFEIDPEAIIGPYKGVDDFHAKTHYAYEGGTDAAERSAA